jgi:hypothetical protein
MKARECRQGKKEKQEARECVEKALCKPVADILRQQSSEGNS